MRCTVLYYITVFVVMKSLKKLIVTLIIFACFASLFLYSLVGWIVPRLSKSLIVPKIFQYYSKILMSALNVKINVDTSLIQNLPAGSLVVANHVSYLDMPLLASIYPVTFVSTFEFKEIPFFGYFARLLNCIIIERRSFAGLRKEITQIETALADGQTILFFPESKATNGVSVLPFKRPFFVPAELKDHTVLVYTIQYSKINGEPCTLENRDLVYWYWQIPLLKHVSQFIDLDSLEVKVHAEVIRPHEHNCEGDGTTLAQVARQTLLKNWRPLVSEKSQSINQS